MGLTYGRSMISAMLDDVWSDVGNVGWRILSTLILRSSGSFHTWGDTHVESFQRIANAVYT